MDRATAPATPAARRRLLRRGLWLEYATLGWNVVGAGFVLAAAVAAGSVALAGFGLDSLLEILASLVVIWQLRGSTDARRERIALRVLGAAFFALALYVLGQAAYTLATGARPAPSRGGSVWARPDAGGDARPGRRQGPAGARPRQPGATDGGAGQLVDASLAGAVLAGLLLTAALGWWRADPLAALVLVSYGAREGVHA